MTIESHVDEERRCIFAKVSGKFTIQEIVETINKSVQDPKFRPGFSVLSDHSQVREPITAQQAEQTIEHLVNLSDSMAGSRWAVVTTTAASYGMMRMLSVLAERVPMEVQVFSSQSEAEVWLGLDSEK